MWWRKWFEPKPFNEGFLPEKDGHRVYFAEFGNRTGLPVVMLHGGPGGCSHAGRAGDFDLKRYRIIMFDQRGSGRSQPLGRTEHNTTQDLLDDITRLVNYLNIKDKIILRGASWGSTLALLWAEQNPKKTAKLLLSQVFLANEDFQKWEFGGTEHIYPEFVGELNKKSQGKILDYNNKLIQSDNKQKQLEAANYYGWYERVCCSMSPKWNNLTALTAEELASQRVYMHYAANKFFLGQNDILDNLSKIKDIETIIVHNRLDLVAPLKGAWQVSQGINKARLVIVPDFGHVSKLLSRTIRREFKKALK